MRHDDQSLAPPLALAAGRQYNLVEMYAKIRIPRKQLDVYESYVGPRRLAEIRDLAAGLGRKRVLHLTATAFGGGAPEQLAAMAPLMSDLGLDVEWRVVRGSGEFARVNKTIANALGGLKARDPVHLLDVWASYNSMNARLFSGDYDLAVIHDPAPSGIPQMLRTRPGQSRVGRWLWHCHLDLTAAQQSAWELLRSYLDCCYDAAIFPSQDCVREDLVVPLKTAIPPTIDPLDTKNIDLGTGTAGHVIARYGVDAKRPIVCQVARFIRWGDPIGVIDAYRLAKKQVPELQLVLLWALPAASVESWSHFQRVAAYAGSDDDIHILSNLNEVGNVEQNVFQRAAKVVVHRARRKGFASAVAEASWKARPVVVDRQGVMPHQVIDGQTGYVIDSVEEMADRIVKLLKDQALANEMGKAGREHVRENFIVTRSLRDYLTVFRTISTERVSVTGA